jgi:acetylornithine deacetylase
MKVSPKLLEMIEQLIALPSISSTQAEIDTSNQPIIHLLGNWLDDLGFKIDVIDNPNDTSTSAKNSKSNLVATLGEGDEGLILSGHTDTVNFDQSGWNTNPFSATEIDNKLYGLGTADMKSFLAIAIEAAKEFTNKNLKNRLTIIATADEESTMQGAKTLVNAYQSKNQKLGKYCIIGEPTDLTPIHQHKGVMMESIKIHGQTGHSSDPNFGNNALEGMRLVLNELEAFKQALTKHVNHDFIVPIPTLNLGHIHGGDNPNRICGDCELHIDLRPLPGMHIHALRDELYERVIKIIEPLGLSVAFTSLFDGTPAFQTKKNSKIVQLTHQLSQKKPSSVAFGTEGPYFNELGIETVVFGPGSIDQAHQQNEYLPLHSINPTIEILKNVIQEICVR